jgi:hypothetical protein
MSAFGDGVGRLYGCIEAQMYGAVIAEATIE